LDAKIQVGVQGRGGLDAENYFRVQKIQNISFLDAKTLIDVQDCKFWTPTTRFASKPDWF